MRRGNNCNQPYPYQKSPDARPRTLLNGPVPPPADRPPGSMIQPADQVFPSQPRAPLLSGQPPLPRMGGLSRSVGEFNHHLPRPNYPPVHPPFYPPEVNASHPLPYAEFAEQQRRRERGFDKGPQIVNLEPVMDHNYRDTRPYHSGSLPNKPVASYLTYEPVRDDMDISKSRSPSPISSRYSSKHRSSRDARSEDSKNSKSSFHSKRGRSRSPSYKESAQSYESVSEDQVRDGIVHSGNTFHSFLTYWIRKLDEESRKSSDRDIQGSRQLIEKFTKANRIEKRALVLPPEFDEADRAVMLHCDVTILGFPSAMFYGSGYGPKETYAKHAAAKDLVSKCNQIGVISNELFLAISDNRSFDRKLYQREIYQAVDTLIQLRKAMSRENFPKQIMSKRHLDTTDTDRFRTILRAVIKPVNSQREYEKNQATDDSFLEEVNKSRKRAAPSPSQDAEKVRESRARYDAEEVPKKKFDESLAAKEKEIRERLRKEMEEEIRSKVVEEERAKLREELEREKKIQMILIQQKQFEMEKEQKERERVALENQKVELMIKMKKEVDEDMNNVLDQIGNKIHELNEKRLSTILEMIYSSAAYKKITSGKSMSEMSVEQKQQLIIDLKAILKCASITSNVKQPPVSVPAPIPVVPPASSSYSNLQPLYPPGLVNPQGISLPTVPPMSTSVPNQNYYSNASYMGSSSSSMQQGSSSAPDKRTESKSRNHSTAPQTEKLSRFIIGDLRLRSLTFAETQSLPVGTKVISQDMKTGKWQLATVLKISKDRALLGVGTATWKKRLDELYWEDDGE